MTWDPSIPDTNTSPGLLPTTAAANWGRLQDIVGANHQFNTTAASTDGYHEIVEWNNQAGSVGNNTPLATPGVGQLYTKTASGSEHLCYQKGTDNVTGSYEAILSMFPVRSYVIFNSSGTVLNTSNVWNAASPVVKPGGTGVYRIDFGIAMPSLFYIPIITVQPSNSVSTKLAGSVVNGSILTTSFQVQIWSPAANGTASEAFDSCMVMVIGG